MLLGEVFERFIGGASAAGESSQSSPTGQIVRAHCPMAIFPGFAVFHNRQSD